MATGKSGRSGSRRETAAPFNRGRQKIDPQTLSVRQLAAFVAKGFAAADEAHAAAVVDLARLRRVRGRQLAAEQARLCERPGAAARLQHLERAAAANARTVAALDRQADRARVTVPAPEDGAYRVYGLVRDADRKPVPDHTVVLADQKGRRIQAAGHACTDAAGTFTLTWKDPADDPADDVNRKKEPAGASAYVKITAPDGAVVHTGRRALRPRSGGVDYVEVVVGSPRPDCADPDARDQKTRGPSGRGKGKGKGR